MIAVGAIGTISTIVTAFGRADNRVNAGARVRFNESGIAPNFLQVMSGRNQ